MKEDKERLVDIRQDASGVIDFNAIRAEKLSNHWKKALEANVEIQKKLEEKLGKKLLIGNFTKKDLVENLKEFCSTGNMSQALLEYLYAGDEKLKLESRGRDGIAVIIARSLIKFRSINTFYYYHIKNISTGNFTELFGSIEAKMEFTRNVVENAISLIKDFCDFEIETEFTGEDFLAIGQCIESSLFYYEHLVKPARQLRMLGLIASETSLPSLAEIKQRRHVISALSKDSFEDLKAKHSEKFPPEIITYKGKKHNSNAKLINALIEDLSNTWELHKTSSNIAHEDDVEIFNSKIDTLIDTLTTGILRASEKAKNKASGEAGRLEKKLASRLEEDPEFIKKVAGRDKETLALLLEEDLSGYLEDEDKIEALDILIKIATRLEKMPAALTRLKKLSPVHISINSVVALDKLESEFANFEEPKDIISPDDVSMEIWESLKDFYKLFLMCSCLGCVSRRGFVEEFNKYVVQRDRLAIRYIRLNIYRIVLEKLTGEKLEDANRNNAESVEAAINKISAAKACQQDLKLNVSMLFGRASEILEEKDASDFEESLANKAYAIFDELQ